MLDYDEKLAEDDEVIDENNDPTLVEPVKDVDQIIIDDSIENGLTEDQLQTLRANFQLSDEEENLGRCVLMPIQIRKQPSIHTCQCNCGCSRPIIAGLHQFDICGFCLRENIELVK